MDGNGFRPVLQGLFGQQFRVAAGGQSDQADAVRKVFRHLDGAGTDGTGAAEQDNVLHLRLTIDALRDVRAVLADETTMATISSASFINPARRDALLGLLSTSNSIQFFICDLRFTRPGTLGRFWPTRRLWRGFRRPLSSIQRDARP